MPPIDVAEQKEESAGDAGKVGIRSVALSVIATLGLLFLLRYAQDLFIPIVLAVLIAYALNPLVNAFVWMRVPRVAAATLVIAGFLGLLGLGLFALRGQAVAALESLPATAQQVRLQLEELRRDTPGSVSAVGKLREAAKELEKTAAEAAGQRDGERGVTRVRIDEPAFRANDYIWSGSIGVLALLGQGVMVSFLVFFLLASGDMFKRKLVRIIGTKLSEKKITVQTINEINSRIERFLVIQAATSALVGVCTGLALWTLGVRQPAVWGLAAGILNSVPYFGPIIVTAGLALIAFVQFGTVTATLQVAGAALAITTLEGFLLTPALMGRAARINGVAMFLTLLFWSWLWGVIGMIVAVPLMMAIKSVCDRIDHLGPLGELLGE